MRINIDNAGRIVIPKKMRDDIGIELNQNVEILKEDNKIVIMNPDSMRLQSEVEEMYNKIEVLENKSEYDLGFENALKFVLRKENE